jgi:8-oxo-dGTP pyrophosphatase MutT (NUDIX family)
MELQLIGQANESFRPNIYKRHAVGVIFMAENTGRFLTLKRAADKNFPHTWGTVGGKAEAGENFVEAALRETYEEAGFDLKALYPISDDDNKFTHSMTFLAMIPSELAPVLNDEHVDFTWTTLADWPRPLYPAMERVIYHPDVHNALTHMTPDILKNVQRPVVAKNSAPALALEAC